MLQELYIENFALIEKVQIQLQKGFNVLTGETGAGKSILIDAVGLLLGGRASSDYVRTGCKKAIIQGVFYLDKDKEFFKKILSDMGIGIDDDLLILVREISENGRNICRINDRIVTLSTFQELSKYLVEIHGQNSNQQLTSLVKQAELLDRIGGKEIHNLRKSINEIYKEINILENKKADLKEKINKGIREKEFLQYQIDEIDEAGLVSGEEEELEKELNILTNLQELQAACLEATELLFSGNENKSAYDLISTVIDRFKNVKGLNKDLDDTINELDGIMYQIQELSLSFKNFSQEHLDYDPFRIQAIEERLAVINKLKRKYGSEVDNILELKNKLQSELNEIENAEDFLKNIDEKLQVIFKEYEKLAKNIHKLRVKTANELETKILNVLKDLEMPNTKFKIAVELEKTKGPFGMDKVEFLISPNPGEPLKPLTKIASGGEMARIMLALKSILAKVDNVPVLIFDEIDAGIGGIVLKSVASKLSETSKFCQVICVTHAPQIASHADAHFYINKISEKNVTRTNINLLSTKEARVEELTRMLGATSKAREHAIELLNQVSECS